MNDNHATTQYEVTAMMKLIICIFISRIATECSGISFETMFLYISTALQLYEGGFRLQKQYNKHKLSKHTNDKNTPDKTI